ncbi:hypothetical protein PHYBLDRAFT_172702 [Phycomyces blakesleeanus NRRL 1555(-)]|uniref:Uncharacterized protein n=1 Tax=Phycomyces blakesleeanus (strain ATCC 8743b / DSM 1359 / FGSC 10004 / NBRC 33097 / NRRL 1555) TaxID=763407 RepID=A0A167KTJ6_PHYB8|nr:hypothetical protein PHYBLDRAFT_172702 [Phycomyces blakesleeanus NRRL 1555(-)]OAD68846.1 hypothetical protein PHYBLDRAFT_172702 [Phycomyces blakesleeanus NRRL 1555(-)]|eukprot:XP_018286886.1 hypothetical protein PHYBLDRAFT_172702 [Phycomyces blakesleeanus NRRL 1555(-)]
MNHGSQLRVMMEELELLEKLVKGSSKKILSKEPSGERFAIKNAFGTIVISQEYLDDMLQQDINNSQYEEPAIYEFAHTNNMNNTTLNIVNNDKSNNNGSDNDNDIIITPVLSTQLRARLSIEKKLRRDEKKNSLYIVS